jgi:hypothetical protein
MEEEYMDKYRYVEIDGVEKERAYKSYAKKYKKK